MKPQEPRRESSTTLKRDTNSDNSMRARRKPSSARTSRCTADASMATTAHTHMEPNSFRERHISQATSWQSSALNSKKTECACMVIDANSYTAHTILRLSWATPKHSKKVPDLQIEETTKSVETPQLSASGPTWRLEMDVEHQRSHVFQSSRKSIIKTNIMRTWTKSKKKKMLRKLLKWAATLDINNKTWICTANPQ